MKFNLFFILFIILSSCTNNFINAKNNSYSSAGFGYIYSENDYTDKIVSKKFDNSKFLISHNLLKRGALIKLTNPNNQKSIVLKNSYRSKYPIFYQILLTESVAQKLELNFEVPYLEIQEIKKNKSFVADVAKTFNEEKKVFNKAPVGNVKIRNISKKNIKKKDQINKFNIIIGNFYSLNSAKLLKKKLFTELSNFTDKNIYIRKKAKNNYELIGGPYRTVNTLKKDYIILKKYGFEELEVNLND